MADVFSKAKRSEVMSKIRSRGNAATELRFAGQMTAEGIKGWRRHVVVMGAAVKRSTVKESRTPKSKTPVKRSRSGEEMARKPGRLKVRPDFVFRKERVAVFVDGCFWHGCPVHGTRPKQNGKFWRDKIERNQKRDRMVVRELAKAGWRVLRIWECGLAKKRVKRTLGRLRRALLPRAPERAGA